MFTRIRWFLFGCVLSLGTLAGILVAFGQKDNAPGTFQPFVVDLHHTVPVVVSIPISDTTNPTATVPLTVAIDLRVNVEGPRRAIVQPLTTTTPAVAVATATPLPPADGEPVANNVRWSIEDAVDLGSDMQLRDLDHLKFKTKGRFIVLHMLLENVGNEPAKVDYDYTRNFKVDLVDKQQRVFAHFDVGYMLEELCSSIKINPGLTAPCIIPFEVPANVTGLTLRLTHQAKDQSLHIAELPVNLQ